MSSDTEKVQVEAAEKPVETEEKPVETEESGEPQLLDNQPEAAEDETRRSPAKRSTRSTRSSSDYAASIRYDNGWTPPLADVESNEESRNQDESDSPPAKISKGSRPLNETLTDDAQKAVAAREPSVSPPRPAKVGFVGHTSSSTSSSDDSQDPRASVQLPLNQRGPPRKNQFAKVHPYVEPTEEQKRAKAEREARKKEEEEAELARKKDEEEAELARQKEKEDEEEAANAVAEEVIDNAVPDALEEAAAVVPPALARAADVMGVVLAHNLMPEGMMEAVLHHGHQLAPLPAEPVSTDEGVGSE